MLSQLFLMFMKIGFLAVGGGYPMMALILQEGAAVGLTATEFADMAALELLASGPIALNAATYVGFIKAGFAGALAATAGICVSPFVLTTVLYYFLKKFSDNKIVSGFLDAVKFACGGILLTTTFVLAKEIFLAGHTLSEAIAQPLAMIHFPSVLICILCGFVLIRFRTNPIIVIISSAFAGALLIH